MLFSKKLISEIQNDKLIGAGNFISQLIKYNIDKSSNCIFLDRPIRDYKGDLKYSFSLNDVIQNANYWANVYLELGLEKSDPVGLFFDDNFNYFIHFLALNQVGAIPVCINHNLPLDVLLKFLKRMDISTLISEQALYSEVESLLKQSLPTTKIFAIESIHLTNPLTELKPREFNEDDIVLLAHTSGTTGIPKGVIFTHNGFYSGVQKQLHKQVGKRILSALPHSHSSAISMMMSALLRGAKMHVQSDRSPAAFKSNVANFEPDLIAAFPKTFVDLCRTQCEPLVFSSVSYWLSTGDANHESHIRKLIKLGNCEIKGENVAGSIFIDNLGSSEFGFAMFRNIHTPHSNNYNRYIGKAFDWVNAEVLSKEGKPLQEFEVGLLGVSSESVTAGYWNNHLLTEKNKLSGYWLTGDLAYKDGSGNFYHVDRVSDKIETQFGPLYSCLAEELILSKRPDIFECSIVGAAESDEFQQAVILVEFNSGAELYPTLLEELNDILKASKLPELSGIKIESGHENVGATGKKLKRIVREVVSA